MSVAVVVLTHNRLEKLRLCVENVLSKVSDATTEIVIWNNGSSDGTSEYLGMLRDPRIEIVDLPVNVGMAAYGRAFAMTTSPYLVQLDDDVVEAPAGWDAELLSSFLRLPEFGYVAADVEPNPGDRLSNERHHVHEYEEVEVNGIRLLEGATGGWCTMTSRQIYDQVGGLPVRSRETYFSTDTVYVRSLRRHGYRIGILRDLRVRHDGDRVGPPLSEEKIAYFERERRSEKRKGVVKRVLLLIPFVRNANHRYGWFEEPDA